MPLITIDTFPLGFIQTNCYLVRPENETACWIVDPGGPPAAVLKIIEKNNLRLEMIINTHGHWDHFMGNRPLKAIFPQIPIAIHPADADVLPDPEKNLSIDLIGQEISSPPAEKMLNDGDTLTLGPLEFKIIHTPGHTPGGICLYCDKARVVFVGDLIFAGGGVGRTDFPGGNSRQLKESIQKLFKIVPDETVVYSGHGPTTTIGEEKAFLGF